MTTAAIVVGVFAAVIGAIMVVSVARRLFVGNNLITALLTGRFDRSPAGRQLELWFQEQPSRSKQREIFVQVALGMRVPSGVVADRLTDCIARVWRGNGAEFGDCLASELDRLIVFDAPQTPGQVEQQRQGVECFNQLKENLRLLDSA